MLHRRSVDACGPCLMNTVGRTSSAPGAGRAAAARWARAVPAGVGALCLSADSRLASRSRSVTVSARVRGTGASGPVACAGVPCGVTCM